MQTKAYLHPIRHDMERRKLWCGQACLASIADKPTSQVYHLIDLYLKRDRVCHMDTVEVQLIGRHLGFAITPYLHFKYPDWHTVLHFMRSHRPPEHTYLVGTPDHWFLADRNLCQDNHHLFPVPYNKFHMRKTYVEEVLIVTDMGFRHGDSRAK